MEKSRTVLVLCNDPSDRQLYSVMLREQGFSVVTNGSDSSLAIIKDVLPAIVLIDLDSSPSPGRNLDPSRIIGRQALQLIRSKTGVPIICLLSERVESERMMRSMRGIVDDFMFKPIRAGEVRIRIQQILESLRTEQLLKKAYPLIERRQKERRKSCKPEAGASDSYAYFRIDDDSRQIYLEGKPLNLTHKEYELLYLLVSNPRRVFSDEELLALIWPYNPIAGENHVQQYIYRLRKKVEPDPCNPRWIITTKGFGYYLDGVEHQRKASEFNNSNE
ncbi:response regulator transcription factor [Nitrosomonas sp. ANs5]|uniref:response regulator transcription factor n=1 Tax=Nitrosomonas sp. ANs5 TaxID=3423941 RepID=UPI003D3342CA